MSDIQLMDISRDGSLLSRQNSENTIYLLTEAFLYTFNVLIY